MTCMNLTTLQSQHLIPQKISHMFCMWQFTCKTLKTSKSHSTSPPLQPAASPADPFKKYSSEAMNHMKQVLIIHCNSKKKKKTFNRLSSPLISSREKDVFLNCYTTDKELNNDMNTSFEKRQLLSCL